MSDDFRYSEQRSGRGDRSGSRRRANGDGFDDKPRFRRGLSDLFHPTEDEKNSAMLCHLLAIFLHFIGPIIIWASKKDQSKFVDWHGREALNFSINMMIYNLVGALVITGIAIVTCGIGAVLIPLLFLVPIYALIMHIIALNAAKRGELYRYPLIFRVIGPPEGTESIADRYSMAGAASGPAAVPANGYSAEYSPPGDEAVPASSGGGMIWVWVVGAFCLLLLLGCFGGIGVFFLVRSSSFKPVASNSKTTTNEVGPNFGEQFPPAGPMGKQEQPGNPAAVPPVVPPIGQPNLPANPPKKADPVDQALDDLTSKDLFVRGRAADALALMQPVHPKRAEVAKALEKLLQDPEMYPRQAAARALPVWATKENMPALIDLLADSISSDRSKIINRLAEFKDERAIKPLAEALRNPSTRKTAADALKGFGPKAEDDVVPLLRDRRFAVKQSACDVLKVIGTKKSIAPLQALANERSAIVAKAAREALDAIKSRNP